MSDNFKLIFTQGANRSSVTALTDYPTMTHIADMMQQALEGIGRPVVEVRLIEGVK